MQKRKTFQIPVDLPGGKSTLLELAPKSANASIEVLSVGAAKENGEAPFQIKEGQLYEYRHEVEFKLISTSKIVRPSTLNHGTGTLEPGNYVGTLTLHLLSLETSEIAGTLQIEIQSVKTDYRTDYRFMLLDIAEYCTELIMQHSIPVSQKFTPDHKRGQQTIYQRFSFIKSLISSEEFDNAMSRIVRSPVEKWDTEEIFTEVIKLKRLNQKQLRQYHLSKNDSRTKVSSFDKTQSVDTAENRFIKYALTHFLDTCTLFRSNLDNTPPHLLEVVSLQDRLIQYLSHPIFKDVGILHSIPYNSQILQRKDGYREVLRVWIMFEVASQLCWSGGDDVYDAGKKDVATLYEYWLFFQLIKSVTKVFKLSTVNIEQLFESTNDGLNLKLKRRDHFAINTACESFSRKLQVQLSYNRPFSKGKSYPDPGSWTTELRPDFTLSLWPKGLTSEEAERDELIVHVHFDAKYKAEYLSDHREDDENENEITKKKTKDSKLKSTDIIKMHAYKDAIRRTAGAYVLYPGTQNNILKGFHEVLPGLGAFAVRPSHNNSGINEFEDFLNAVVELLLNRTSQREKMSLTTYQTYKNHPSAPSNFVFPEAIKNNRTLLPQETLVLIGYYKSQEHLQWICKSKLYNTRIVTKQNSLYIDQSIINAKYLLLHNKSEQYSINFFKLKPIGGRIFSKRNLLERDYPSTPSQSFYLVFEIEDELETEFVNCKWDVTKLKKYNKGNKYALPFGTNLHELMQNLLL
ncbi:MAG: DUF2357 domain-containing protein [Pseudobacter sp.]|uniref:DUF2357 domain-containing protein n=1 Tax=Pseudobacter sp. TaxID=2045420 RepID=UPI003F7F1C22